jgi:hypothetical protein
MSTFQKQRRIALKFRLNLRPRRELTPHKK